MTAGEIAMALGGAAREGRNWRCTCPLHGGKSLVVRDGPAGLLAHCFGGCADAAVYAELRRLGLLDGGGGAEVVELAAERERREREAVAERRRRALFIWNEARPIAGTLGETYLRARGITIALPPSLRFHGSLHHYPSGKAWPAMVAAVQDAAGEVVAIHRTFLRRDGSGKAPVAPAKMALGATGGCAVRLGPAGATLGLGEGIESALSFMQDRGVPAWAALGAANLARVRLPTEARHAYVVIDLDVSGTGERMAQAAARRLYAEGRRVTLVWPRFGADASEAIQHAL